MKLNQFILCVWVVALSVNVVSAQEVLNHEKKVYVSEDGKIYWNKTMPVYLRLSGSPEEDAPSYLLNSESTAEYANPYFFDTEGVNYIRTRWAVDQETGKPVYPQLEVVWEVYRDGTPPYSESACTGANIMTKDKKIFAGNAIRVNLTGKDELSGVENIYYSLDGEPFTPYREPLKLAAEKEYTLKYYAVDHVGNVEELHEERIVLDFSAPETSYRLSGETLDGIVSSRTSIELSALESGSGIENIFYRIDSAGESIYKEPVSLSRLQEGRHTIAFYAVDRLGNREEVQTLDLYVDNTPPIITADMMGDRFISNGREYSSGRTRVKLTAIDNKAGIKNIYYSINGSEYAIYDKPFFLKGNQGDLKIDYYAVDHVGNKSSKALGGQTASAPYLDLTGPELEYSLSGPRFFLRDTLFISDQTGILLKGVDQESGIQKITYSINKAPEQVYQEPIRLNENGIYEIEFYGFDNVNNSSRSAFMVAVDKDGPEIFPRLSSDPLKREVEGSMVDVYPGHTVLFLSATDARVGYESMMFSINDGQEQAYTTAVAGFRNGDYKISIIALDKLGNQNTNEIRFSIGD